MFHDTHTAAAFLGLPPAVVAQASSRVTSGETAFLVLSGKMASGKDSVAPALLDRLGYLEREHAYYALPLKAEMDDIIATIRGTLDGFLTCSGEAAARVSALHDVPLPLARQLVSQLGPLIVADPGVHARTRSDGMRAALQIHGTDVRRAQDEHYWVRLALRPVVEILAEGVSVFLTDGRFPNEMDAATALHAWTVRLDITAQTQRDRLLSRDGITEPDPKLFTHPSETALDDYRGFNVRIATDGLSLAQTVDEVAPALLAPAA